MTQQVSKGGKSCQISLSGWRIGGIGINWWYLPQGMLISWLATNISRKNLISDTDTIKASMQSNGNLVLIGMRGTTWSTNTIGNSGAYLAVKNNGELVIQTSLGISIWSSKTQSNCTGSYFYTQHLVDDLFKPMLKLKRQPSKINQ